MQMYYRVINDTVGEVQVYFPTIRILCAATVLSGVRLNNAKHQAGGIWQG